MGFDSCTRYLSPIRTILHPMQGTSLYLHHPLCATASGRGIFQHIQHQQVTSLIPYMATRAAVPALVSIVGAHQQAGAHSAWVSYCSLPQQQHIVNVHFQQLNSTKVQHGVHYAVIIFKHTTSKHSKKTL